MKMLLLKVGVTANFPDVIDMKWICEIKQQFPRNAQSNVEIVSETVQHQTIKIRTEFDMQ